MQKITLISEKIWLPNPVQDGAHKHSVCWSWFTHRTIISCNHPKSQILQIINQHSLNSTALSGIRKKMQRSDSTSAEHRCADWPLLDVFFPVAHGGETECTGLMDVPRCCANNTDTTQGSEIIPQIERHPILVTLWYLVSETNTLNESKHKTVAQQHTTTIWSE